MRPKEFVLAVGVLAVLSLIAAPARAGEEWICGTWTWFDGNKYHFKHDNTIHHGGKKVGEWYKENFKHNGRQYEFKLVWANGFTDWLNQKDGHLVGINNEGAKVTGHQK